MQEPIHNRTYFAPRHVRHVLAQVHPTADKLYCEEIDTGDASGPRTIASGLRAHYSLEEMQGRRVVVIANLKPRPLVGFMSHGECLPVSRVSHRQSHCECGW